MFDAHPTSPYAMGCRSPHFCLYVTSVKWLLGHLRY